MAEISQIIDELPVAGHRGVDTRNIFVSKQELFQDTLQGTFVGQVNNWTTQANAVRSEVNTLRNDTETFKNTATTQAGIATTKASEASSARDEAVAMRNEVQVLYDNFDDRYLGSKTTDPTLDNDGNALINGALYYNSSSNVMKVYDIESTTWFALPQIYLSALLDVQLTSIATGDSLMWNGTKWVNYNVSNHIPLSGVTAYNLLQGSLSVSNEVITNGFSTTLYTGNGGTQSVVTDVDMDTQWGNDASEKFGGLVWAKNRDTAAYSHFLFDTIRGATNYIMTNSANAQAVGATMLTAFNSTGFDISSYIEVNGTSKLNVSWNFQTTHRRTGTTNHGKAFTEHYNPFTGFTIIKYTGSGVAGHEIPHSLGRKLDFVTVKNLSSVSNWLTQYKDNNYLYLNTVQAQTDNTTVGTFNTNVTIFGTTTEGNNSSNTHIMYGWTNSYFDESNKLIGNYEIGTYVGTGVSGNKVTTKGKPSWIMIKRLDSTGNWIIQDIIRYSVNVGAILYPNLSNAEVNGYGLIGTATGSGFTVDATVGDVNIAGGQYLYMVVYDNDSGSGKSKYPRATDSSNLTINNAIIPFAQGIDSNGTKVSTLSKNETITGLTYTAGKNYVYAKLDGTYGVTKYRPRYLDSDLKAEVAGDNPDYFDVLKNKWFSTVASSELVTNGDFSNSTTGWTAGLGATLTIESNQLKLLTNGTGSYAYQTITTVIGKTYNIFIRSIWESANSFELRVGLSANDYTLLTKTVVGSNILYSFVASSTTTYITLREPSGTNGHFALIDGVSVYAKDLAIGSEITSRTYPQYEAYTDASGQLSYVRELPKIEYKDIVKANEYQGKNACTAWANIDMTTTPPTIRDSYNISSVIRTSTGFAEFYFKEVMDNTNYAVSSLSGFSVNPNGSQQLVSMNLNKFVVVDGYSTTGVNRPVLCIQVFGGKN